MSVAVFLPLRIYELLSGVAPLFSIKVTLNWLFFLLPRQFHLVFATVIQSQENSDIIRCSATADGTPFMDQAFICDALRTPFGRYGGSLASVRTDDLAAHPIKALMERHPSADWSALDDVIYGCANQAGEDNRNVARMALLLAGLPKEVSGSTVNRLCGSSMDAVATASRAI